MLLLFVCLFCFLSITSQLLNSSKKNFWKKKKKKEILQKMDHKITAMTIDTSQRRMFTGTDKGVIKGWNFSSGQTLCDLKDSNEHNYAHWKNIDIDEDCQSSLIRGAEVRGIVCVMEAASWTCAQVEHWLESFRDKHTRYIGKKLVEQGVDGSELLQLTHEQLANKYNIDNAIDRRKILQAVQTLFNNIRIHFFFFVQIKKSQIISPHYVVSVGWDNKVRIWEDKSNKTVQHAITVLPNQSEQSDSNQIEITCLCYCPPSSIVTGGFDGSIVQWNLLSGHLIKKYTCEYFENHIQDSTCTCVLFLKTYTIAVSGHVDGSMVFWHIIATTKDITHLQTSDQNTTTLPSSNSFAIKTRYYRRATSHQKYGGITAMTCDAKNTVVITGDTMDYFNGSNLILTGGHDNCLFLWTSDGTLIGYCSAHRHFHFKT
ncbi:hypothetical protein RFI_25891 [Reticulomyxa filosa]|uniref:SAM domain-containing protein n=1 Tax=Reticulomyxa filosa TaxID=46433 RepID=X6MBU8_RETFI|nr:hypothetical protein RFI_25891 [Reticulomyxa filosa]|eukprot:ETO11483.1 hypothetical protein RFI_25891 [Reticulomyxa filosa]